MSELNVALLQSLTTWHNPDENLKFISSQINRLQEDVDLIVLPEMWLTGFTMKAHQFWSVTENGVEAMKQWSMNCKATIVGSLITKVGEEYYNRAYVVSHGKVETTYDKKHLFAFSGEDRFFHAGKEKCIFTINEIRICLNVCYDLRFPVWSRNDDAYDVLIYCANWPEKRISAWDVLLKARAIENQSYVLGVNCTGEDAWHNLYTGHSSVVNFDGENLEYLEGGPGVLMHTLSLTDLQVFRKKFPFLKDRDQFELK